MRGKAGIYNLRGHSPVRKLDKKDVRAAYSNLFVMSVKGWPYAITVSIFRQRKPRRRSFFIFYSKRQRFDFLYRKATYLVCYLV